MRRSRDRTTAARLSAILILIWLQPAVAHEEIKLTQSINVLPDSPSGVRMIMKTWVDENDARNRFVIELFSKAESFRTSGNYYERVLGFLDGKQVEFSNWEAPDCSLSQVMAFRVQSTAGLRLVVGAAERIAPNSREIVPQSDPRPQRIRIFIPKKNKNADEVGRSPVWLDSAAEGVTDQSLCTADDVRHAIAAFVDRHAAELDSK